MPFMKSAYFWNWFLRHHAELGQTPPDYHLLKPLMADLQEEVQDYNSGLRCHLLLCYGKCGDHALVITANADPRYFDAAEELVNEAPNLPHWKVMALFPAFHAEFGLEKQFDEFNLSPSDFYIDAFYFETTPDERCVLQLYLNYDEAVTPALEDFVHKVAINCVGEELYGLTVGKLVVQRIRDFKPDEQHVLSLDMLGEYLEVYRPRLEIGQDGGLQDQG